MTTLIIAAIVCATVITSIVNFAKPAYEPFAGKFATTINMACGKKKGGGKKK